MEKFKLANLTIINNNLKENTQEIFRRAHNDCPNLSTTIYKKKNVALDAIDANIFINCFLFNCYNYGIFFLFLH